jgi:hypothetical protein
VYKPVGVGRGINRAVDLNVASGVCMKEIKARGVCVCVKELEEDKIWLLTVLFTSFFFSDVGDGSWVGLCM